MSGEEEQVNVPPYSSELEFGTPITGRDLEALPMIGRIAIYK